MTLLWIAVSYLILHLALTMALEPHQRPLRLRNALHAADRLVSLRRDCDIFRRHRLWVTLQDEHEKVVALGMETEYALHRFREIGHAPTS